MFSRFKKIFKKWHEILGKGFTPPPILSHSVFQSKMFLGDKAVPLFARRGMRSLVGGFTLVELLVVLTLVLVLSTISINSYLPFVAKSDYQNVVLDVALEIRKYQLFGVGSVQTGANFDVGYGVHVEKSTTASTGIYIVFFKDTVTAGDNRYNATLPAPPTPPVCSGECMKIIKMEGYAVKKIMGDGVSRNKMDIAFKRPYLDASFYSATPVPARTDFSVVSICIQPNTLDPAINYSKIVISRTGQVSVQPTDTSCS